MFNNNNGWLFVEEIMYNTTGCSIQGLGGGPNEDKISIPVSL